MALPERERYRIEELADEWRVSEGLVEEYLETGKLTASVVLTQTCDYLRWFEEGKIPLKDDLDDCVNNIDEDWLEYHEADRADDLLCGEIDTEAQDMITETDTNAHNLFSPHSGLYHINRYDFLAWDSKTECDLKQCRVRLTSDDSPNIFYVFEKSKIISKDCIRITKQSIKRFLRDYCGNDTTLPVKLPALTFPNIPPRLEAAISVYEALYHSGKLSGKPKKGNDHKGQVTEWLIENYPNVVEYPTPANKSKCNESILDAIYKVITENSSTPTKKKSKN